MVTAPQPTVSLLPPTLELQIESSDLRLELGGNDSETRNVWPDNNKTLGSLPVANGFSLPLTFPDNRKAGAAAVQLPESSSKTSISSFASSLHRLSFGDDDWMGSVLAAANANEKLAP